jgi:hypothetical protein
MLTSRRNDGGLTDRVCGRNNRELMDRVGRRNNRGLTDRVGGRKRWKHIIDSIACIRHRCNKL